MSKIVLFAAALGLTLAAGAARADDAADCEAGITMIKAEQAKTHPKAVSDTLKTSLRVAEREKGEKEWDECVDAVADARKALGKKN